jgi:heat shock protein HslJ
MRLTFFAVPLLLVLAGCGARPAAEGTPDPLRGRTFLATAVTEDGAPRALVAGTELSVEFTDDGRLIARAGCNTMQGPVSTADGELVVDGLSMTEMGCGQPMHEQDSFVASVLTASPSWRLDGDRLTITSGSTTFELAPREAVRPDKALVGTTWVLDTLVDGEVSASVPAGVPEVTLVFDDERVVAETHCNGAGATYTAAGDRLVFQPPGATDLKLCTPEIMLVETAVTDVLAGEATYRITADRLTITNTSGEGIQLHAR